MSAPALFPEPERVVPAKRAPRPDPPEPPGNDVTEKLTEADVLAALAVTYAKQSQGMAEARFVFATHVRCAAGFGDYQSGHGYQTMRTADAVAMDLWPSKGLALHGHEVKVSRSDWLTELKQPEKCQPVKRFMDRWWLVVPDRALVKPGELPADWGLMVVRERPFTRWNPQQRGYDRGTERYARVVVQAPRLRPEPVSRSFVAALLRATAKTARKAPDGEPS